VLVYPAGLTQVDGIAAELGFAAGPDPNDSSRVRAVKPLRT